MTTKKFLGVFLSFAIAVPSNATVSTTGTVKGVVSLAGRGLDGLSLTLVNVETGKSFAVRSAADGSFTANLPAGSYVFSSPGRSGISISRAPLSVDVVSGKVASANVEVASLAVQAPAAGPVGSAKITHDSADCIVEGEFAQVDATFEPLASVVNGRLYFQSNLSPEWFYTEFEKIEPAVAGGPTHRAFIPKVTKDGGIETINYYLQVTSSDFAETKSPEKLVKVVSAESECQGKVFPIGNPEGAVAVLSASGAAAGALAGFGGVAGVGLGALGIAAIIAGVTVAGVAVNEAVTDDATPTPTATVVPSTPTPTPVVPSPTPVALCNLNVQVQPASTQLAGALCTVLVNPSQGTGGAVTSVRVFSIPCNARVELIAVAGTGTSTSAPAPASWSQACSGPALGRPCVLLPPLSPTMLVGLTCELP